MARVEESLSILSNSIEKSALAEQIGAGIVLTGGMTKLKGIRELAQAIFRNSPIRIGYPKEIGGLTEELKDPAFSTVIGLLLYQIGGHTQYEIDNEKNMLHTKSDIPEFELSDIKLKEQLSQSEKSSVGNKVLKDIHPDEDEDTFSFDDLPRPDTKEGNILSKISNWAKQLF
jgi:cell division protein FtsA